MNRTWSLSIGLAAVLFASPALALPITWHLKNVTFTDGGSASGSFVFDADTGLYSGIAITTTAGASISGTTYGIANPSSPGNASVMIALDAMPAIGVPELALNFATPLTNAGGKALIKPTASGGFSFEGQCFNSACTIVSGPQRGVAGGAVTTAEPASLALVGFGLAGVGVAARRRRAR